MSTTKTLSIVDAIKDPNLFRPFLGKLASWTNWLIALRAVYGLPIDPSSERAHRLLDECAGRTLDFIPPNGFDTTLFLTGRRSGKSRIAAVIGAYEAALAGHESKLAPGERGVVPICAPTKYQGRIVRDYLRAIFDTPLLRNEVAKESREGFELKSGTRIEILAGDFRTVRGYTLLAAIVDEAAFFGYDEESKVKNDTELVRALKPALDTVQGRLIAISSPYARRGWCYQTHQRCFGTTDETTLVWNCPSRTMNPLLSQKRVDAAMAEDPQAARSEYLGEFRDDVAAFITAEIVTDLVPKGCQELLPRQNVKYMAFADLSGGRGDDAALAIAHREDKLVILDLVKRWKPPFDPRAVCGLMANDIKRYGCKRVTGDNYAAEFVAQAFSNNGLRYDKCEKPKAMLYAELLPRLCSREIRLLDNPVLVTQLTSLERRTRSGGRDIIDHPPRGHDDLANAVAGVADATVCSRRVVGAF